ncbi:DEAD/DEAH box helicase [Lishizhenia sp.]|uniref:DEAD/DEAH box helicase n=1 Tax=Lishizhenia sp. TaxID=2497594 RepID=UPI00299D2ECF|nr:DEAD/DEAH box helicase [Lishizhenia sp.]MDX1444622.1 DEAD/DEAH box helicase [Lishizhenia sp.]
MTFESLGLKSELLEAVQAKGYTQPSPIQEKAIPEILKGRDILASAQTGTGKTAGFTLPLLHKLSEQKVDGKRAIRALILTPTRELASQVYDSVRDYGANLNLKSTVIFGGVNQNPQVRTLKQGVDILVATPGRLLDLHNQKHIKLNKVEVLVLDEADRMLDMGFLRDIERIMKLMPKQRQNLMFSATFSKEIKKLAGGILNNAAQVEAAPENTTAERVDQLAYRVDKAEKTALLIKIIFDAEMEQVLIFTRTKYGANRLCQKLDKRGIKASAIHGNKSQNQRTAALKDFKAGKIKALVATDIAARGLDIPLLPHVINYELPNVPEDYVHRIGRTGRAGAAGLAISLVGADELGYLKDIEKLLKTQIPSKIEEGFEPQDEPTPKAKNSKQKPNRNKKRKPDPNSKKQRRKQVLGQKK